VKPIFSSGWRSGTAPGYDRNIMPLWRTRWCCYLGRIGNEQGIFCTDEGRKLFLATLGEVTGWFIGSG